MKARMKNQKKMKMKKKKKPIQANEVIDEYQNPSSELFLQECCRFNKKIGEKQRMKNK
jgi:hypothetical protein